MSMLSRRALLAAPLLAAGCTQARMLATVDALTPDSGSLRVEGAAFGPHPRQKLDLYAPKDARGRPAVLFLYGGAWRQGERALYRFAAESLVARGAVVMVADYRIFPEVRFPEFVRDTALACRWAVDNLPAHGGDPQHLSLLGHSAGGYNALMLALDARWLAEVGLQPRDIARVVALAPPTGIELPRSRWLAPIFADADPPGSAYPIRLAVRGSAGTPPITLVAGEADVVIRAADVRALGAALARGGAPVETLILPEAGHIEVLADLWTGTPRAQDWVVRLVA
jgi:acetyl esterase/lipase